MTLRARLALGLAAIALVLVLPQVLSIRALRQVRDAMDLLRERDLAGSRYVGRIRAGAEALPQLELAAVAVPDSVAPRERLAAALDTLELLADSLQHASLATEAKSAREQIAVIRRSLDRQRALAVAGRGAAADTVSLTETQPAIAALVRVARIAEVRLQARAGDQVKDAADATSESRRDLTLALAGALLLAAIVAALLTRSISRPVHDLETGMAAVADGDFTHRLPFRGDRRDEFGRLAASYGTMTRQLAELDKLKAEFVSVASHELKTPINVILGYLQLLEDNMYGDLTPKQREILRTLTTQGHTLNRLVKQLLDVSRFEAGGGRIEPRRVVLASFLRELEEAFQVLAHQREVHFAVVREPELPEDVVWDPDRMNEVLGNLLSNAFKFTERGGRVELVAEPMAGKVHIEVCDTGAGIPSEQLPRIFEKFFQADNQASASAKGTGLGLAISKGIVDAHGGTIEVRSTPGSGTTFSLLLPRHALVARRSQPNHTIA